ncbi:transposase domain-containing protein [Rhizobium beringeri]
MSVPRRHNPFAYLTATLTGIDNGHKQSRIVELLPWDYPVAEGNGPPM